MAHSKVFRRYACGLISLAALVFCACAQLPEYCGDGQSSYDTKNQFCYGGTAYWKCGGKTYDPVHYKCDNDKIVSKTDTVPTVTPPVTPATYLVTVSSAGSGSSGGGSYAAGASVAIYAGEPPSGKQFKNWTSASNGVGFANANSATTTFTMPTNAVTVTANFETATVTPPVTPTTYLVTVSSAGTGAIGGGSYEAGETVTISAGTAPSGQQFKNWTTSSAGVTLANANSATTTFTMPTNAVTVTANFETATVTPPVTPTTYLVTVSSAGTGAIGGGSYEAGVTVTISAGTAPSGQQFKNWTTSSAGVTLANANSSTTTFTMPTNAVTVTANFETATVTPPVTPATYAVTVSSAGTNHSGTGSYEAGVTVTISAGTAPSGQKFKNWTTTSSGVTLINANSATTTFTMPKNAVTVTAVFETTSGGNSGEDYDYTISCGNRPCETVEMPDGKTWMAENLNYATTSGSWCYGNSPDSCVKYGRLYDWATAMGLDTLYNGFKWNGSDVRRQGICPTGWHLPSSAEWETLIYYAGGYNNAGKKLISTTGWNTNGNETNEYGFSALPSGLRYPNGTFIDIGERVYWWAATEINSVYAENRNILNGNRVYQNSNSDKSFGESVRCIKD